MLPSVRRRKLFQWFETQITPSVQKCRNHVTPHAKIQRTNYRSGRGCRKSIFNMYETIARRLQKTIAVSWMCTRRLHQKTVRDDCAKNVCPKISRRLQKRRLQKRICPEYVQRRLQNRQFETIAQKVCVLNRKTRRLLNEPEEYCPKHPNNATE